ncbi:HD-GYP domain-containing protein [Xanthomonas massiliensis]|uniref:HD-GYP domain-containing protein n=1 Tax=Xanthomonas massiliensis TaxID=1720302 RepID=UPI00082651BA|nr:HD domain-containing phosphohydrolase [Xanthomonas massiliensis]
MHPTLSLEALAVALDERDGDTRAHCERVAGLAGRLGRRCGLPDDALARLVVAARFHDIGKIGVPDAVLHRPGRLHGHDWQVMQSHAVRGQRIFAATAHPWADEIGRLIRHHHEALDGSGYPDGLRGARIGLGLRILRIADCYDAMVSHRPYGRAHAHEEAMAVLHGDAGRRVDAAVLAEFEAMLAPARATRTPPGPA